MLNSHNNRQPLQNSKLLLKIITMQQTPQLKRKTWLSLHWNSSSQMSRSPCLHQKVLGTHRLRIPAISNKLSFPLSGHRELDHWTLHQRATLLLPIRQEFSFPERSWLLSRTQYHIHQTHTRNALNSSSQMPTCSDVLWMRRRMSDTDTCWNTET